MLSFLSLQRLVFFFFSSVHQFFMCLCFFVYVPKGGGSLISDSVGPLTVRISKRSSLIRPVLSSSISIKPSELREQRCRANIFVLLSISIMIQFVSSSQQLAGNQQGKNKTVFLSFDLVIYQFFICLFIDMCVYMLHFLMQTQAVCVYVIVSCTAVFTLCTLDSLKTVKSLHKGSGVWACLIVDTCWDMAAAGLIISIT